VVEQLKKEFMSRVIIGEFDASVDFYDKLGKQTADLIFLELKKKDSVTDQQIVDIVQVLLLSTCTYFYSVSMQI
jgi:hypothetical protein